MDKMPITQNWIEQIFEQQIDWDVDCPNACFVSGEFVNAIAQAHEQEVARARSEKTELLPCGHPASVADDDGCAMCRLVAQVAMLTSALRELSEHGLCGIDERRWAAYEGADKALSGAPKVVWRGPAVVGRAQLLAWDHTVLRRDSTIRPLSKHVGTSPGVILGEEVGTDGELVDLILLECPPKGEQPEESEQEEG